MSRSERVADAIDRPWLRELLARVPVWRGVLVLNYHRVGDSAGQPWDRTLWSASAEALDQQLELLAAEADVIGLDDLPHVVAAGRGRHVLLTFDDGYRDNYEIAFPLLRRRRVEATFFLATGFLDDPHVAWWDELVWMVRSATAPVLAAGPWLPLDVPLAGADPDEVAAGLVRLYKTLPADRADAYLDYVAEATGAGRCGPREAEGMWMTWEMARELRDGGMTIGGHTVTHPILARLPVAQQEREIADCLQRLQEELGAPTRAFSYPVGFPGSFTDETRALVRRHGIDLAFSFYGGYARFPRWDPLDVPRIHVGPAMNRARLHATWRLPQLFARPD
jgi:peptidoglycan/xylan/chitin deacetylase (PgdA/CDA1 family)